MKYRKIGRAGFEVSEIAHGLWGMGGWSGSEDSESLTALQLAVLLGCNFFDTAWAYGEGKSDGLLGRIIRKNREKRLYAASKIPPMNQRWPALSKYTYCEVFPPQHVFKYADLIRKNIGADSIDLLQFHVWSDHWADEADFRNTVLKLKQDGVIRSFGLSLNRWEPENGIKAIRTDCGNDLRAAARVSNRSPAGHWRGAERCRWVRFW